MINNLYREIAARLTGADLPTITKEVWKYANRARVRMQGLQKEYRAGTLPYKTMSAIKDLQQAGLLTKSGNISLKLPKTRGKLLTVLRKVTGFLVSPTTKKDVKQERKKELDRIKRAQKRKPKKPKAPKAEPPKVEPPKEGLPKEEPPKVEPPKVEPPKEEPPTADTWGGEYEDDEDDEDEYGDGAAAEYPPGLYWGIARDLGLVDSIGYEEVAEHIEDIASRMSPAEFERAVYEYIHTGAYLDNDDFFDMLGL